MARKGKHNGKPKSGTRINSTHPQNKPAGDYPQRDACVGIEGRPVNVDDFMPQIELTLQVLEQAMRMENFAKEQVKHGWGL